eukprot:Gb_18510 [translate_table: standard]
MGMETMMIPGMLEMVYKIIVASQNVPVQKDKCRVLAEQISRLGPLLESFQSYPGPFSPQAKDAFKALWHALNRAYRVVQKMQKVTKLRLMFQNTRLGDELSSASSEIQVCLGSLPLVQLGVSAATHEEVIQLKASFEKLGEQLKDTGPFVKDQQDLAAEVLAVLRSRQFGEDSGESEQATVMDKLLAWLAERFDSDVDTVRQEWQELKEDVTSLLKQLEYASENKHRVEEELLQQIVLCMDDLQQKKCVVCSRNLGAVVDTKVPDFTFLQSSETPKEFTCSICLQVLNDPVIIESGHSYCKVCIESWFAEGHRTCPQSRAVVHTDFLVENLALRGMIIQWKEMFVVNGEPMAIATSISSSDHRIGSYGLSEGGLDDVHFKKRLHGKLSKSNKDVTEFVTRLISELRSEKQVLILKSLRMLNNVASTPCGALEIFRGGGVQILILLLKSSNNKIVEQALSVLKLMSCEVQNESANKLESLEPICSTVADLGLDTLISLMKFGSTKKVRVLATQTLANIIIDEEVRDIAISREGIIVALCDLANIGNEGLWVTEEAKEASINGLQHLAGNGKFTGMDSERLATALIEIACGGETTKVIEESLIALEAVMKSDRTSVCSVIQSKGALSFLVHLLSVQHNGKACQATLNVLKSMAVCSNLTQLLVDIGLIPSLVHIVHRASNEDQELICSALVLLTLCLSHSNIKLDLLVLPKLFEDFIDLIPRPSTSVNIKLSILSLLEVICNQSESTRMEIYSVGVCKILIMLGQASDQLCRLKALLNINLLVQSTSFQVDFIKEGGVRFLCSMVHEDDTLGCRGHALLALERLVVIDVARAFIVDDLMLDKVVELLRPECLPSFREAAAGVACILIPNLHVEDENYLSGTIEHLIELLRQGHSKSCKKKVVEALAYLANTGEAARMSIIDAEGFNILISLDSLKEFLELVAQILVSFAEGSDACQIALIQSGGFRILLEALEKVKMREKVASSLLNLMKFQSAQQCLIEAGFINMAIRCMNSNCSTPCSNNLVKALILLFDCKQVVDIARDMGIIHTLVRVMQCSSLEGKKLSAVALSKLALHDQECRVEIERTGIVKTLLDLLRLDMHEVLDALTVLAKGNLCKRMIHEHGGVPILISILSKEDTRAQELASSTLRQLTLDDLEQITLDLCFALQKENIAEPILAIMNQESPSHKLLQNAIAITRNLSLASPALCMALLSQEDGVVSALLEVIRRNLLIGYIETVLFSVIALERFMTIPEGRMAVISLAGIGLLVQILQQDIGKEFCKIADAKTFVTRILVMIASDPRLAKTVCSNIYQAGPMSGLKDVLENGSKDDGKRQAAILLKCLIRFGPTKNVCKSAREAGCIEALLRLRAIPGCMPIVTEVLETLKSNDKLSKAIIKKGDGYPWARSLSGDL